MDSAGDVRRMRWRILYSMPPDPFSAADLVGCDVLITFV